MTKIIMLGTGNGMVFNLYNTCFAIQNEQGIFLIDTGGSVEIIKRLKQSGIKLEEIKNIFISHSHTDHILGLIWMFKKMGRMATHGEIKEKTNIYCNDVVYEAITEVSKYILSPKLVDAIHNIANFIVFLFFFLIHLFIHKHCLKNLNYITYYQINKYPRRNRNHYKCCYNHYRHKCSH